MNPYVYIRMLKTVEMEAGERQNKRKFVSATIRIKIILLLINSNQLIEWRVISE